MEAKQKRSATRADEDNGGGGGGGGRDDSGKKRREQLRKGLFWSYSKIGRFRCLRAH